MKNSVPCANGDVSVEEQSMATGKGTGTWEMESNVGRYQPKCNKISKILIQIFFVCSASGFQPNFGLSSCIKEKKFNRENPGTRPPDRLV